MDAFAFRFHQSGSGEGQVEREGGRLRERTQRRGTAGRFEKLLFAPSFEVSGNVNLESDTSKNEKIPKEEKGASSTSLRLSYSAEGA